MEWNLADAKNRFSEVVNLALTEGPQTIHRRRGYFVVVAARSTSGLPGSSPRSRTSLPRANRSKGSTSNVIRARRDVSP